MRIWMVSIWLLITAPVAVAYQCSPDEAQTAERISATLDSWQSIFVAHKRYGHCDDGAIAEGFTESVVHLLASKWVSVIEVQRLISKDPSFKQFVIHHINASADSNELKQVAALATQHCPISAKSLCKEIFRAAHEK